MYGKKHPQDEGVYMVQARLGGQSSGRASATRAELVAARGNGQRTIHRGGWDNPDVDVAKAWRALLADDERLGRR